MRFTEAKEHPQKVGIWYKFVPFSSAPERGGSLQLDHCLHQESLQCNMKNSEVNSVGEDRHTAIAGSIRKTLHRCQGHYETWSDSTLQSHAQLETFS